MALKLCARARRNTWCPLIGCQERGPKETPCRQLITQPTAELSYAPSAIKVLLADDHPLIIAGIRRTIEHLDDIDVVGEAHNGAELVQLIGRRAPDTVLMDLNMPGYNGLSGTDLIAHIRAEHPTVKVVVLSACDDRPTIDAALHAGASAYVLKSAQTVDIAAVVRQASSGAVFHAPSYAPAPTGAAAQPAGPALTDRERSILRPSPRARPPRRSAVTSGSASTRSSST